MRNLLNSESPLMQTLGKLADLVFPSILLMLCSLPIFTIGAAICAAHKVMQSIVLEEEAGVIKPYLKAFKDNFKQATIAWLAFLAVAVVLALNFRIVHTALEGNIQNVAYAFFAVLSVTAAGTAAFLFPLMTRYENTLKKHLFNALILAVGKFPRTLCMVVIHSLPFLMLLISPAAFIKWLIFWLMLGTGFLFLLDNILLRSVYIGLEKKPEEEAETEEESNEPEEA